MVAGLLFGDWKSVELLVWAPSVGVVGAIWLGIVNKRRLDRLDARDAVKFEVEHNSRDGYRLVHTGSEPAHNVSVETGLNVRNTFTRNYPTGFPMKPHEVMNFDVIQENENILLPDSLVAHWETPKYWYRKPIKKFQIVRLPSAVVYGDDSENQKP